MSRTCSVNKFNSRKNFFTLYLLSISVVFVSRVNLSRYFFLQVSLNLLQLSITLLLNHCNYNHGIVSSFNIRSFLLDHYLFITGNISKYLKEIQGERAINCLLCKILCEQDALNNYVFIFSFSAPTSRYFLRLQRISKRLPSLDILLDGRLNSLTSK